jgi:hypothetical protein
LAFSGGAAQSMPSWRRSALIFSISACCVFSMKALALVS